MALRLAEEINGALGFYINTIEHPVFEGIDGRFGLPGAHQNPADRPEEG
jgi:hypothetical protein